RQPDGAAALRGADAAAPAGGREGGPHHDIAAGGAGIGPRDAGPGGDGHDHLVRGRHLPADRTGLARRPYLWSIIWCAREMDDITEAVLSRDEVARYLAGNGDAAQARARILEYLEELRTTQRYELYRALEYPLYPILRKIERVGEQTEHAVQATAQGRVVWA